MKIAICSSMKFAKEIMGVEKELRSFGHEVFLPHEVERYARGEVTSESADRKIEHDFIKKYFKVIEKNDAVLILNYDKNDIKDYVGGNSFLEMGFAYVLDKKIFLLNPIPNISYADEIIAMQPVILDGDLTLIA